MKEDEITLISRYLEFIALLVNCSTALASAALTSCLGKGIQWGKSGTFQQVASGISIL